jgi:hypothetical protein
MYEKDRLDPHFKQDPRRSVQTPSRSKSSHLPVFQQPLSGITVQRKRGESLTKQLLRKEQREKLVRGYKEIMWQQRTMDDDVPFDFDPFTYIDDE